MRRDTHTSFDAKRNERRASAKFDYGYGSQQTVSLKRNRKNRKRRDYNRPIRLACYAIAVVEVIVFLLVYPGFRIKTVRVEGAKTITAMEVFNQAHIPAGGNIIWLALHEPLVKRVSQIPVVDHATRAIALPDTLVLRVTEREPYVVLKSAGRYWLVDRKRTPYREISGPVTGLTTIAAVSGAEHADFTLGKPIKEDWLNQAYKLMALLTNKENLQPKLITVDQNANLCLNKQDKLRIILGTPDDIDEKLSIADTTLQNAGANAGDKIAYIDVSCVSTPVLMTRDKLRELTQAQMVASKTRENSDGIIGDAGTAQTPAIQ